MLPTGGCRNDGRGIVHLKMLVWHRDEKDSLQDSGLLLRNVDRASGLLVKGLMLHIITKSLCDGHLSIRKGCGAARVQKLYIIIQPGSEWVVIICRCYDSLTCNQLTVRP